ncbi:MAG: adenosylcobinamide-GDP ribazoletransferase [Clostridia bacterium]|nr:adenosylcobinamide-GDP ribazoletransferase [Clostridia bacterium]
MHLIHSFIIAFSTYSRIPMPRAEWTEENKRFSMCFFPLVGAAVGLVLALWLWICNLLGIGFFLRGAVASVLALLVTGGIHMDGFMDTMDDISSWQTRERRLEILKDSHTGAFAVIGCGAYLIVSAGLYSELGLSGALPMACAFVLSRALSALALVLLPKANPGGLLSGFAKAAQKKAVCIACAVYILACTAVLALSCGVLGIFVLLAAFLSLLAYRRLAMKHFGGVTGDLAGWFVQVAELACLAVIVIGGKIL